MSAVMWDCISKCWSDDIYIDQLIHRFWKLNLQLIARYAQWIKSIHSTQVREHVQNTFKSDVSAFLHLYN